MSPQQALPRPQGVSRSRRCRELRTGDDAAGGDAGDAAGGVWAGFPPSQMPFPPLSLQDSRGLPMRGEKVPTCARPLGCQAALSVLRTRWQRGWALGRSSGGLGAPAQDLGLPEPPMGCQSPPLLQPQPPVTSLTVTFHPLVNEPVQQRPAVVTEGGAGVRVDFKFVFAPGILGGK